MKFKFENFIVLGICLVCYTTTIQAQKTQEIPVLYNTEPTLAIVNDSAEIVQIVKLLPGFMSGYLLEKPQYDTQKPKKNLAQGENQATGYTIISSDYKVVQFRPGFAVLEDEAVVVLDKLFESLKENPNQNLLISVFNDYMTTSLYKNRINAIRTYAKVEGIDLYRIKISYLEGATSQDEFRINFIE
ncbi:MAG: hypothetical protein WAT79_15335 [Saprospiraceae bacterium]